ncbi:MAG: hypothetical protein ACRDYE_05995, partial [Acidimicrobiales bacterium]
HRHEEFLPGTSLRPPGGRVELVVVPGSPGVLATPAVAAMSRTSGAVFIAPAVLVALLLAGAAVMLRLPGVSRRPRAGPVAGGTPA